MKIKYVLFLGTLLSLLCASPSAKANVYATNIKLNGATNNVAMSAGGNLQISYILNEPATSGVSIDIFSENTVVRTLTIATGNPGAVRGTNSVSWDGKDGNGSAVAAGTYSIRITANATGYSGWTQISNDTDPGNYIWEPRGVAVNKNTNSPFYGRIFLANSHTNTTITLPGDQVGILKANADGSFADEGGFSTGGYAWAGDLYSPWKLKVSDDDYVYVNDWTGNGIILRFDQLISSNNYLNVLRDDNNPTGTANMTGPAITGAGANTQVWMADVNYTAPAGTGITRWNVTADGTCAQNDKGTKMVRTLSGSDINIYPYDVAVDKDGYIYTIQYRLNSGDAANRVMRFPPYSGATEAIADWKIGSGSTTFQGAFACAVDPTATYVAVAFLKSGTSGSGGLAIFYATNGVLVTRSAAPLVDYRDVAWDNVGNLYACDNFDSYLRVYSPPGTNQAVTVAVESVAVSSPLTLSAPSWSANQFQFTLNGQTNQNYTIQTSTDLVNWTSVSTNNSANATQVITLPAPTSQSFYRALVGP